jgi:hypothetical protein
VSGVQDRLDSAAARFAAWSDRHRADLAQALDRERVLQIADCFDHELRGPLTIDGRQVLSTCAKCSGRFRIIIEDLS